MEDIIRRQDAIDAVKFGITYAKAINTETGEVKELFQASNEELEKAKKFIFLEYFIVAEGKMWGEILEILKRNIGE